MTLRLAHTSGDTIRNPMESVVFRRTCVNCPTTCKMFAQSTEKSHVLLGLPRRSSFRDACVPSIHSGNLQIRLGDLLVQIAEKLRHTWVLCIMEAPLLVVMKTITCMSCRWPPPLPPSREVDLFVWGWVKKKLFFFEKCFHFYMFCLFLKKKLSFLFLLLGCSKSVFWTTIASRFLVTFLKKKTIVLSRLGPLFFFSFFLFLQRQHHPTKKKKKPATPPKRKLEEGSTVQRKREEAVVRMNSDTVALSGPGAAPEAWLLQVMLCRT